MKLLKTVACVGAILSFEAAFGQANMTSGPMQVINDDGERLTLLSSDELKAILPGTTKSSVPPTHLGEMFGPDGSWIRSGHIVPIRGRYSIRGDQYCLEDINGRELGCHKVFRGKTGRLFTYAPNGKLVQIELKPITPLPTRR